MSESKNKPAPKGFTNDGRRYVLRDPHLIDRADGDLWNDTMHVQMDHRGRCDAWFLQPNQTSYSEPLRCFYIRDDETGEFWSAPLKPVCAEPDEFEFSVGLGDLYWRVVRDGLEIRLRLVVPRDDNVELWTAELRNVGRRKRKVSLISLFPVGSLGKLTHRAWFDERLGAFVHKYFPYYVHWEDYFKLRKLANNVFCASNVKPSSWETNLEDFTGERGLHDPAGLARARLARGEAPQKSSAAAFQYARTLAAGKSLKVNFAFGPAQDRREISRLKRKYLRDGGVDRACKKVYRFLDAHKPAVEIDTPDEQFNHFINHWQARRALMIGRTMRLTFSPQGRNAIQDAMGAVYTNPEDARSWLLRIFAHQQSDGWVPHGMPMAEGAKIMAISEIPHRDTCVWGAIAVYFYLAETGDLGILDESVPFADDARGATLYEHICRALEWLLADRTKRNLSRLGEGDWNDPLNMAGKQGRGESIWLTEALSRGLDDWAEVADHAGDNRRASRYRREAETGRKAVRKYAWDGSWYARGTTDAGRWFGTSKCKEGKIFLNAQSWAIIGGVAGGQRLEKCVESVERYLATPPGPMTLHPPFQDMRENIGKLTQKQPGTGENGSVYSHAATFYAYSLLMARRSEHGWRVLRNLLPGTRDNPVTRCGQLPLYVPNFYRGTGCGKSAGQSSHRPNTGTSAWYYRTAVAMVMGVRAELDVLRIDPQLPKGWKHARVRRKWRGAGFDIQIRRGRTSNVRIELDGEELADAAIPPQPAGSRHEVLVTIPQ
ncbi:MAG: GH36-type glycosyl hydrolase domain-containing protein [Phycisphaerae bacterium]